MIMIQVNLHNFDIIYVLTKCRACNSAAFNNLQNSNGSNSKHSKRRATRAIINKNFLTS